MSNSLEGGRRKAEGGARIGAACRKVNLHSSPLTRQGFKGFTLLEVLIAVAIMAGIVTIIYSSFFTASRNVEQAEAIRDSSDMARTLVTKIADDISDAYYNPGNEHGLRVITIFNGKKEQTDPTDEKSRHDNITLTTLTNWRRPNYERNRPLGSWLFFQAKAGWLGLCHDAQGKARTQ